MQKASEGLIICSSLAAMQPWGRPPFGNGRSRHTNANGTGVVGWGDRSPRPHMTAREPRDGLLTRQSALPRRCGGQASVPEITHTDRAGGWMRTFRNARPCEGPCVPSTVPPDLAKAPGTENAPLQDAGRAAASGASRGRRICTFGSGARLERKSGSRRNKKNAFGWGYRDI